MSVHGNALTRVTLVEHALDNTTGKHVDLAEDQLVQWLTEHRRVERKGTGGWLPARFRGGPCDCGREKCPKVDHRIDDNVVEMTLLVADIDEATEARINEAVEAITGGGLALTYYTSFSHRPEKPKVRLVMRLSRPVPRADWPRFWTAAMARLGLLAIVDRSCRNVSRLYYPPECPSDAQPEAAHFPGAPVDVDAVLAEAAEDVRRVAAVPQVMDAALLERVDAARAALDKHAAPADAGRELDANVTADRVRLFLSDELGPMCGSGHRQSWLMGHAIGVACPDAGEDAAAALAGTFLAQVEATGGLAADRNELEVRKGFIAGAELGQAAIEDRTEVEDAVRMWAQAGVVQGAARRRAEDPQVGAPWSAPVAGAAPAYTATVGGLDIAVRDAAPAASLASWGGDGAVEEVTASLLRAQLQAAKKRLSTRKDAQSIRESHMLRDLIAGRTLPDEDRAAAVDALLQHAPLAATDDQLAEALVPAATMDPRHAAELVAAGRARRARGPSAPAARPGELVNEAGFALAVTGPTAGKPLPSQGNIARALSLIGVTLRHDEFADVHRYTFSRGDELLGEGVIDDAISDDLLLRIERDYGFRAPDDYWRKVLGNLGRAKGYHPVRDYLDEVAPRWDGAVRLGRHATVHEADCQGGVGDEWATLLGAPACACPLVPGPSWLTTYGGAPDTAYVRAVGRLAIVAAARRARRPGALFQELLVLEGPQGGGKSTALKALCPDPAWFTDQLPLGADAREMMEATQGRLIVEVAELQGLSKSDENKIKAYLSRVTDSARGAYMHHTSRRDRQFVPIGTTNEEQYLGDPTGNRRWWPVRAARWDVAALIRDRDQLWAEAVRDDLAQAEDDAHIRMDPSLYAEAAAEQEARVHVDPYEVTMGHQLADFASCRIRVIDVMQMLSIEDPGRSKRAGGAMKRLGFRRVRDGGSATSVSRGYWYVRGTGELTLRIAGSSLTGWTVSVDATS